MNKNTTLKQAIIGILLALVAALGGAGVVKLGSAQSGLMSTIATSSSVSVGQASVVVLFPSTKAVTNNEQKCSARLVTTDANPIYIGIVQGSATSTATSTLQLSQGIFQAASTTVIYDSGQLGCGNWIVKGAGAATGTVSISESR